MSFSLSDPGAPTYVEDGYVNAGYQLTAATGTTTDLPPAEAPPDWTDLPDWATDPLNPPLQGVPFTPPSNPPDWPTLPPTLPATGSPTGASSWSAGPTETGGDELGYGPPVETPFDDGITFPAHQSDLVLKSQWHGLASTLNPANIAAYNAQLETTIAQAISDANRNGTSSGFQVAGGNSTSVSLTLPADNTIAIRNAVEQAVFKAMLQGTGLWYELVLKPVTNGPFTGAYVVPTLSLALPKAIDLKAPAGP